jgi:hypothetical protein
LAAQRDARDRLATERIVVEDGKPRKSREKQTERYR